MSDAPEANSAEPTVERIDSIQYIRVLLDQMVSRCHLVKMTTEREQQTAVSSLVRVDGENREILLDNPYATDLTTEFELSETDLVNISGKNYVSSISFQAEFKDRVEEEGLSLYRFTFPQEVSYFTQRTSHRVDTRNFAETISFTSLSGYSFETPLCDISGGGVRVKASKAIIKGITKGDEIFCNLDVGDGSCDHLKVDLCKPSKTDDPGIIEFGAIFVEPSSHQQNQISQYISGLERKLLRKQHSIPDAVPLNELAGAAAVNQSEQSGEFDDN